MGLALGQALREFISTPRRYPLGFTPEVVAKDSYVITPSSEF